MGRKKTKKSAAKKTPAKKAAKRGRPAKAAKAARAPAKGAAKKGSRKRGPYKYRTEAEIKGILKEAAASDSVASVLRKRGVAPSTYHAWKTRYRSKR